MNYIAAALCLFLVLILFYHFGFMDGKEHAALAAPTFRGSVVNADRARQQDERGLTVTDYMLEANLTQKMPISDEIKIMGWN